MEQGGAAAEPLLREPDGPVQNSLTKPRDDLPTIASLSRELEDVLDSLGRARDDDDDNEGSEYPRPNFSESVVDTMNRLRLSRVIGAAWRAGAQEDPGFVRLVGRVLSTTLEKPQRLAPQAALEHGGKVTSVSWSPDGTKILTGCHDKKARVFDLATLKEEACLEHAGVVLSVSWSPDGMKILTGGGTGDKKAHVFDLGTLREEACLEHGGPVFSVSWSPDGTKVLTGSGTQDKKARVFDVATLKEEACLEPGGWVRSVSWSPDGTKFVTGNDDEKKKAFVYDLATLKELGSLEHRHEVRSVSWSLDGTKILTGCEGKKARVFDVATMKEEACLEHGDEVRSASLSPDGTKILTGSLDRKARVFDLATLREEVCLEHGDEVNSASWSPDGTKISTGSFVFDVAMLKKEEASMEQGGRVNSVSWSPDGTKILTGCNDDMKVRVFDVATLKEEASLEPGGIVLSVSWSPDGTKILTGCDDRKARVFDRAALKEEASLEHGDQVNSVCWSPDGTKILTGSNDKSARVFDVATLKEEACLEHGGRVFSVSWSPDGTKVLTGSNDKSARVFDVATLKEEACLEPGGGIVWAVSWSPDGTKILTGSNDKSARVFDVATLKEEACLEHGGTVWAVSWSPDGTTILTGSADRKARVFDLATLKEDACLEHVSSVRSVSWSPDGTKILTGCWDKKAHIFPGLDASRCLAQAVEKDEFDHFKKIVEKMGHGQASCELQGSLTKAMGQRCGRYWLSASAASASFYLLAQDGRHLSPKQEWDAANMLRLMYEQPGGVEAILAKDSLGLNAFDIARLMGWHSLIAQLLSPQLLEWMRSNPAGLHMRSADESLQRCLSRVVCDGKLSGLPRTVSLSGFLEACCVAADSDKIGCYAHLRLPPPPSTVDPSLDIAAVTRPVPLINNYDEDKEVAGLLAGNPQDPLQVCAVLLPGFAQDSWMLRSLVTKEHPDQATMFQNKAIRALVDVHWRKWHRVFLIQAGLHLFFLSLFVISTCSCSNTNSQVGIKLMLTACSVVLVILEVSEMIGKLLLPEFKDVGLFGRLSQWLDAWTLLGLLVPILVTLGAWHEELPDASVGSGVYNVLISEVVQKWVRPYTALLVWLYTLHYLQAFVSTSFYVLMVAQTFMDMRAFLLVFMLVLCAFAHAFHLALVSVQVKDTLRGAWQRVFRLGIFGDFEVEFRGDGMADVNIEDDVVLYSLFLMCAVAIPIVFLNILIAIISDTYDFVREGSISSLTNSRALLIFEMQMAFWWWPGSSHDEKFLIFFTKEEETAAGDWQGKLSALRAHTDSVVGNMQSKLGDKLAKVEGKILEKVEGRIANVEGQMADVKSTMQAKLDSIEGLLREMRPRPAR